MPTDTGGPAFARPVTLQYRGQQLDTWETVSQEGMTILDHFAGKAFDRAFQEEQNDRRAQSTLYAPDRALVAKKAYAMAKEMVAEKRRQEKGT